MPQFIKLITATSLALGGFALAGCSNNQPAGYGEIQESTAPIDTPARSSNLTQSAQPSSSSPNAGWTNDAQMQRNPTVTGNAPPPATQPAQPSLSNTGTSQQNAGSGSNGGVGQ